MAESTLAQLLRLPAGERAELAKDLWNSLSETERERHFTPEQRAELGRRAAVHMESSPPPVAWQKVRQVMQGGD